MAKIKIKFLEINFGGKLLALADGRSYIICSFHGLFNAENPIRFGPEIRKLWFFLRSDFSKLQATVILHTIIFMNNKPHHDDQREKLNKLWKSTKSTDPWKHRLWSLLKFTLKVTSNTILRICDASFFYRIIGYHSTFSNSNDT